ncbi:MAG TPA: peptidyl-prolyl cis-trans isomerase [Candidatus Polarisedimenticolia bacterium]|nr:peptidyl-prolyl cis-trans isomerase [Candidatus Polarisedimenticolia bacterium]
MLNVFREKFKHLKWVLWIVIASFVLGFVYGIGALVSGTKDANRTDWAARVDGEVISVQRFQDEARNLDSTYRQLLGAQYDSQRAYLRIGLTAVNRLIDGDLLEKEAGRAGLSVTGQEVAEAVMKDPSFQQNGAFVGRERYEKLYRSNPVMFENFESSVRRQLLVNKLRSLVEDSAAVTEAELKEVFRRQNEKATFEYLILDASRLSAAAPSDAEIEVYYKAHLADYSGGEGRSGKVALFSFKEIAKGIDVPESEVRSQYLQDQKSLYTVPEKRRASHVLVKVASDAPADAVKSAEARIRKALSRLRQGEDFVKVAKEVSEDSTAATGGDVGYFTRDQMVREFAEAAWSMKVGDLSEPVRTPFGFHVIKLTDQQPAHELTLEEARPQILEALKQGRVAAEAQRRAEGFSAALSSGDFGKAASSAGAEPRDFKALHAGEPFPELGPQPALSAALFALKPGESSAPTRTSLGIAVVQYLEAAPPAPLPLASVRDRVREDIQRSARVESARKLAGGGGDLAALAKKLKVQIKNTGAVPRSGPAGELGGDASTLDTLFALAPGAAPAPLSLPNGSVAFARLTDRPDPMQGFDTQKETLRNSLLGARRDQLFRAYLAQLRARHRTEINTAMIEQIDKT